MVDVVVARGHTVIGGAPNGVGRGKAHGPGEVVAVPEKDVARLHRLGAIVRPQSHEAPQPAEPPPIEQPVPRVSVDQVAPRG
jgi:hypothetical protein